MNYNVPDVNSLGANRKKSADLIQNRIIPGYLFRQYEGQGNLGNDAIPITTHISIDRRDTFICDSDFDIASNDSPTINAEEFVSLVEQHRKYLVPAYRIREDYYNGRHLSILNRKAFNSTRDDFRNIINLPKKLIDSFTGYAAGVTPKIQYNPEDDDTDSDENVDSTVVSSDPSSKLPTQSQTDDIQSLIADFLTNNDFDDVNSSLYRDSALHGRAYLYVWTTGDNEKTLHFKEFSPTNAFVVYSHSMTGDTPKFGVLYYVNNSSVMGQLITPTKTYNFSYNSANATKYFSALENNSDDKTTSEFSATFDNGYNQLFKDENDNPILPLIEKTQGDGCTGMVDGSFANFDAIDEIVSTKTNENQYFNNAYMSVIGPKIKQDELNAMASNHIFNITMPDGWTGGAPSVSFISPNQNDESEEHQITRLVNDAYEMSSIVNLNDPSMGQTASGEALDRKLQPMMLVASDQERRMRIIYRQLFKMFFYVAHLGDNTIPQDGYTDMDYQFHQNKPHNLTDEVSAAKNMVGLTSIETALSTISAVKDVSKELKLIDQDKQKAAQSGQTFIQQDDQTSPTPPDSEDTDSGND